MFAILVLTLKLNMLNNINKTVYDFYKEYENTSLYNTSMTFSNFFGSIHSLFIFLVIMLVFLKLHKINELIFSVIFATLSIGATLLLKYNLLVQRPLNTIVDLSGYSFPSGHVVMSFLLAVVFFLMVSSVVKNSFILQSIKLLLVVYVFISMFTRVFICSHWISDVIGSILLVMFLYAVACLFFNTIKNKVNL